VAKRLETSETPHDRLAAAKADTENSTYSSPLFFLIISSSVLRLSKQTSRIIPGGLRLPMKLCDRRHQIAKTGASQAFYQFILRITPDGADGTVILERTNTLALHTFVELDGAVDRLNHLQ